MATLVIPRTIQISVQMNVSGQDLYNVLHFRYPDGTFINATDVLTSFKSFWEKTNGPLKLRTTGTNMVQYHLTDLSTANGVVSTLTSTVFGATSAAPGSLAACGIVKLTSGTRSRAGAGRLFHGPLATTQIAADGRSLDATFRTALTTAYTTLKADMATINLEWVVASRKNSSATPITAVGVAPVIGTQRRRLR